MHVKCTILRVFMSLDESSMTVFTDCGLSSVSSIPRFVQVLCSSKTKTLFLVVPLLLLNKLLKPNVQIVSNLRFTTISASNPNWDAVRRADALL